MRAQPGIYLVAEQRLNQKCPGPMWLGTAETTRAFFAKLQADGFELYPTTGNRALMRGPGRADRIVWLETDKGKPARIAEYL